MKINKIKYTEKIALAETVASISKNVLFLDVIKWVEIVNNFTDVNLLEFTDADNIIDYVQAYDSLEENGVISKIEQELGLLEVKKIDSLINARYSEINSLPSKLVDVVNGLGAMTSSISSEVNKINPEAMEFINKIAEWKLSGED